MVLAVFAAMCQGAGAPAFSMILGNVINIIGENDGDVLAKIRWQCIAMGCFSVGLLLLVALWHAILGFISTKIATRIRLEYMERLLSKDMSWFDVNTPGELPVKLESNIAKMQDMIGFKAGLCVANVSQLLVGFIVGYIRGWQVALALSASVPLFAFVAYKMASLMAGHSSEMTTFYAKAGAVVEEVFSQIRTVVSFNGQNRETSRYTEHLEHVRTQGIQLGLKMAIMTGATFALFFGGFALAYFVGAKLIVEGVNNPYSGKPYTGGDIWTVIFCVLIGTFGIGQASSYLKVYAEGTQASSAFFQVRDATTVIEPENLTKINSTINIPPPTMSKLKLQNVSLSYASREGKVLSGVNLEISAGQKVAIVGQSGSGKSSALALLERFYDPVDGGVLLNGVDIRELPVGSVRSIFAYVGQEPVLFAASIRENLLYGLSDSAIPSDYEISKACEQAHILDFIKSLPEGFDTFCGSGGSQVSGGQKQRIALARALLRKPQVLLLDEATSALDNESEKAVQTALDSISALKGLTTISVAHRLSSVRNSDIIFVLEQGQLVEKGSHRQLMEKRGVYYALVSTQEVDTASGIQKGEVAASTLDVHTIDTDPMIGAR